jgi:hypothetical protein
VLEHVTVDGNVIVPPGAELHMNDAIVRGDVIVEREAFAILSGTAVHGDIDAVGGFASLCGGSVGGGVTARNEPATSYSSLVGGYFGCDALKIGGDVRFTDTAVGPAMLGVTVGGSVVATHNGTASADPYNATAIEENSIAGDLTVTSDGPAATYLISNSVVGRLACTKNDPDPDNLGFPNSVTGLRSGETCGQPGF